MFAVPILLTSYYNAQRSTNQQRIQLENQMTRYNEKLSIGPTNIPTLGPSIWVNNTGTIPVTLSKLYLINLNTSGIYAVVNLSQGTPPSTDIITEIVDYKTGSPIRGGPITLQPGDSIIIVFNETTLGNLTGSLAVRIESARGILHPIVGGGAGAATLAPPAAAGGAAGKGVLWRGIYATQSGFKLIGYKDLAREGDAYAWKPPLFVQSRDIQWYWWGAVVEPYAFDFTTSFIYNDPKYPGLYYLYVVSNDDFLLYLNSPQCGVYDYVSIGPGYKIVIHGFLGTYDTLEDKTYISGYAFQVLVYDSLGDLIYNETCDKVAYLGNSSITHLDFDENGVDEMVFYSLLNGPAVSNPSDIDADQDGSTTMDALAWTYMVARDISDVDFIHIIAKVNYYWTDTFSGSCPSGFRHHKIFSVVVWRYDNTTGAWKVFSEEDYIYTNSKPRQFHVDVTFPVERNGTYRVGLIFYDNYRDWDGYGYYCYKDFTFSLEYVVAEYGVLNPFFKESPPVYIVAIPNGTLINSIGEVDYALKYNISNITEAKIGALNTLLRYVENELEYAGITGYTVIRDQRTLCNLLFTSATAPKHAIILWLQGNTSISQVAGSCGVNDYTLDQYIAENKWVWVWPYGNYSSFNIGAYEDGYAAIVNGPFNLTITPAGRAARRSVYAFYLYDNVNFTNAVKVLTSNWQDVVLWNSTFYADNTSNPTLFGDVALWVYWNGNLGGGIIILNPVHIDWDGTGDGVPPQTVVEQIIYSALDAWQTVRYG